MNNKPAFSVQGVWWQRSIKYGTSEANNQSSQQQFFVITEKEYYSSEKNVKIGPAQGAVCTTAPWTSVRRVSGSLGYCKYYFVAIK